MEESPLARRSVLLGVCGSVAAYRAAGIARELIRRGATVHVVLTSHARKFVSPALFAALTGNPCTSDTFDEPVQGRMAHIDLPSSADLFLVAPATAHTLAKFAHGLADDMLSTAFLANVAPVLLAPAMNPKMLSHPATQASIALLRARGCSFVEPVAGRVACGDEGVGKLAAVADIVAAACGILSAPRSADFTDIRVLVTAGPTYEPIDPVRFLGNRSSGKMGYAIAEAAAARGAAVTLVTGPTSIPTPCVQVRRVNTAEEMFDAVASEFPDCDILIAAAAVSDYRTAEPLRTKMKRSTSADHEWTLKLVENPDIVGSMAARKCSQVVVGFAAETDQVQERAS